MPPSGLFSAALLERGDLMKNDQRIDSDFIFSFESITSKARNMYECVCVFDEIDHWSRHYRALDQPEDFMRQ